MGIPSIGISVQPRTACPEARLVAPADAPEAEAVDGSKAHRRLMTITECAVQMRMEATLWGDPAALERTLLDGRRREEAVDLMELDAFTRYASGGGSKLSGAAVEYEAMGIRDRGGKIDTAPLHRAIEERNERFLAFYEREIASGLSDREKWERVLARRPHYPRHIPESFFEEPDPESLEFLYAMSLIITFVADVETIADEDGKGVIDSLAVDPGQRKANCYARSVITVDLASLIGYGPRLRSLSLPGHLTLEADLGTPGTPDPIYVNYAREFLPGTYYAAGGKRAHEESDPPWTVISGSLTSLIGAMTPLEELLHRGALKMDPDGYAAHSDLGLILHMNGRHQEAEIHYLRAIEINPKDVTAHFNLALLQADTGRWEEAVASYDRVLELNPDLDEARERREAVLAKMADAAG